MSCNDYIVLILNKMKQLGISDNEAFGEYVQEILSWNILALQYEYEQLVSEYGE